MPPLRTCRSRARRRCLTHWRSERWCRTNTRTTAARSRCGPVTQFAGGIQPALPRRAVSQNCILRTAGTRRTFGRSNAQPITNRRYGRVRLCATSVAGLPLHCAALCLPILGAILRPEQYGTWAVNAPPANHPIRPLRANPWRSTIQSKRWARISRVARNSSPQ